MREVFRGSVEQRGERFLRVILECVQQLEKLEITLRIVGTEGCKQLCLVFDVGMSIVDLGTRQVGEGPILVLFRVRNKHEAITSRDGIYERLLGDVSWRELPIAGLGDES